MGYAELHVIGRNVAEQGDQYVVIVLDRGIQVGTGAFNRAAEAAPEIEFPGQVEVVRKHPVILGDIRRTGPPKLPKTGPNEPPVKAVMLVAVRV